MSNDATAAVAVDAAGPTCPHCKAQRSYRLKKLPPPLGETRTCQNCWRNFNYQTPEEVARADAAVARILVSQQVALERIKRQAGKAHDEAHEAQEEPVSIVSPIYAPCPEEAPPA